MIKWLLGALLLLAPSLALAQNQGQIVPSGRFTPGHTIRCQNSTCTVAVDGGGSAGSNINGQGYLTEIGITNTGTPFCINDALTNAVNGYHQFCLGANALGGAIISYNALGGASPLSLAFNINGASYAFPFTGNGNVVGPTSPVPTVGDVALWNGGTALKDGGLAQIIVNTNSDLAALTTTATPNGATRNGVAAKGDAPPLLFLPETGTCAANSRVNDVGSCVNSGDGNSFYAVFPSAGADVREWGVIANNSTDNTATFQNAFNWALTNKGSLLLPAGTIFYAAGPTGTIPVGGSVSIRGAGPDLSILRSSATGMQLTKSSGDQTSSIHLRDFSIITSNVLTGNGIDFEQTGNTSNPAFTAASDITNVVVRGSDAYSGTKCFANGFLTNYVSNINFTNDTFSGCTGSPQTGNGINLSGGSSTSTIGVVYNISGSTFNLLGTGVVYGSFIQGVTVSQSNFTFDKWGIHVPAGGTSISQLTVVASQFGVDTISIFDESGVIPTSISDNFFFLQTNNTTGYKGPANLLTLHDNTMFGSASPTGILGVEITAGGFGGTINANAFSDMNQAIQIDSGAATIAVSTNSFGTIATPVTSSSSGIFTYQGPSAALVQTAVTGAASGTGAVVRLTVSADSGFTNGQVVMATGVGGITACGIGVGAMVRVTIVDSTHVELPDCPFAGSYTAGGILASLQP